MGPGPNPYKRNDHLLILHGYVDGAWRKWLPHGYARLGQGAVPRSAAGGSQYESEQALGR